MWPTMEIIISNPASAKVIYRGPNGKKFTVLVRQKPNPIGFHAKLPGDR